MGKYGEEGNQLIFKILKRGEHEASGQADLALRYDLTVPLARVVAQYQSKLPRLFKRYQIQPVWRADRPARGRFREFYQCDVDALGSTSPVVEAELCAAVSDRAHRARIQRLPAAAQSSPAVDRDPRRGRRSRGASRHRARRARQAGQDQDRGCVQGDERYEGSVPQPSRHSPTSSPAGSLSTS